MNARLRSVGSPVQRLQANLGEYWRVESPLVGLTPEQRALWARRVAAARRGVRSARRLRTSDARSALTLLREAALELWTPFREEEDRGAMLAVPAGSHARLDWAVTSVPPSELDTLDQTELETVCDELERALDPLLDYARRATASERSARLRSIARRAYLVGAFLALIAFVVLTAGGHRWLSRTNLALGARVTATPPAFGTTLGGAVDGYAFGQLGYHSAQTNSPWLTVDLGRERQIQRVIAYGRSDCCFDQ